MPSPDALPTILELLDAFAAGVIGQKDPRADVRRGSVYDHWAGAGAILFTREAQHDRDLFRANYLDTADGDALTELVARRFAVDRVLPTFGTGFATLSRESASAGAGTIWRGTRILLSRIGGVAEAREYVALDDGHVGGGDLLARIPIRAAERGTGYAVDVSGEGVARVDDPLWDATWKVQSVVCADGTGFERAAPLRARARNAMLNARRGYAKAISDACVAEGAAHVALFASNYGGDASDFGINACYVADVGYSTSTRLVRACTVALERFRVCGADLLVLGMTEAPLRFVANVTLWDDPGQFNLPGLEMTLRAALSASLEGRANGYAYSLDALRGAMMQSTEALQDVDITTPAASGGVLVGTPPNFPPVLTRYTLDARDVILSFRGAS